jgi:mannose-6-phosphate isomerase-like protein (cupin superfamily)
MIPVISLQEQMDRIEALWSPVDLAEVNDQVVRMARIQGHYHWHRHHKEDELFYVLQGEIVIDVKGAPAVHLHSGEMAVIPKGVEHRPTSEGPSYILMFEPLVLQSRGD